MVLLDIGSLIYSVLVLVPHFMTRDTGQRAEQALRTATVDTPLVLGLVHFILQLLLIKLTVDMVFFRWYKKLALFLHVCRVALLFVLLAQGLFRKSDTREGETFHSLIHYFAIAWLL